MPALMSTQNLAGSSEIAISDRQIAVRVHDAVSNQNGRVWRRVNGTENAVINLDFDRAFGVLDQQRRRIGRSWRAVDA